MYTSVATTPEVGSRVFAQVLDHPEFQPGTWVWTGTVLRVDGQRFESRRTLYVPVTDPDKAENEMYEALIS
jgi:hypothetical protein